MEGKKLFVQQHSSERKRRFVHFLHVDVEDCDGEVTAVNGQRNVNARSDELCPDKKR